MDKPGKWVLVTGVSSGIGQATAVQLGKSGYQVLGSIRKPEQASMLQQLLGAAFHPLIMDITDKEAVQQAVETAREKLNGQVLTGIINNAGIFVGGPLAFLPLDEAKKQLEVNVLGTLRVIQGFLPLLCPVMVRQPASDPDPDNQIKSVLANPASRGRIINVGSIAGKIALPFNGMYAASKFALEGMNESLRRELAAFGVKVIMIRPGNTQTPIFNKMEGLEAVHTGTPYQGFGKRIERVVKNQKTIQPQVVAKNIQVALEHPRPRISYVVDHNKFRNWILPGILPLRQLDRILHRITGLKALEKDYQKSGLKHN